MKCKPEIIYLIHFRSMKFEVYRQTQERRSVRMSEVRGDKIDLKMHKMPQGSTLFKQLKSMLQQKQYF